MIAGRTLFADRTVVTHDPARPGPRHPGAQQLPFGYAGQPEAFARKLRDVLDDDN